MVLTEAEMTPKVSTIYVAFQDPLYSSAELEVPGLGKVSIKDCLSAATLEQMKKEVQLVLRHKMGMAA